MWFYFIHLSGNLFCLVEVCGHVYFVKQFYTKISFILPLPNLPQHWLQMSISYPGCYRMRWLGGLLPPPCMEVCRIPSAPLLAFYQVSRQFTAQYNFWVERDNVRVQCLVQEHPTPMSQRVKPRALGLEPNVQAALKPHGQYSFHSIFKEGHWHSVQKDLICNQFPSKTSPNLEDHMTVLMLKFLTFPLLSNRDCKIKIIWSESSVQSPVSHFHRWESLFFISYSKCILFWLVLKYPLTLFTMPLWQ